MFQAIRILLTVDFEIVEFDVVQTLIIERIFQLVLNVVQRDQYELTDQ